MTHESAQKRTRFIIVMLFAIMGMALFVVSPAQAQGGTGSITIVSSTDPAGTTGVFFFTGLGSFTLDDGQSHVYSNLAAGNYDLFQSVDPGWEVSVDCGSASVTPLNNGVQVQLADGENATCTFNYTEVGGSITIVAESNPAGATGFGYFGDIGSFSLDDGQSFQVSDRLPGDYAIFQSIPQAWTLSINCVGGDSTVGPDNVTVHLDANEDVVCTFSNTDIGATITVVAASNPSGATGFDFFSTLGSFVLDDGQSEAFGSLLPGTYDIYQTIPSGWTLDIDCGGATTSPAGSNGVSVTVGNNENVVCTFTNNDLAGSVTVVNATNPAGSTGFFYFGGLGSYTLDDGQNNVSDGLLPGDYQIFQSIPAGWVLDISCVGGDSTVDTGNVTVHLDANEDIVCTFTNTDVGGSITLNTNSNPADGTEFTYFGDLGFYTGADGHTTQSVDLYPGDFNMVQDIPQGWVVDISCTGGDATVVDNSVTIHLDANEDIVCDFNNTYVGGSVTVTTETIPAESLIDFFYFGDLGVYTQTHGLSNVSVDLYPGDYDILQGIPLEWELEVSCTGGDSTAIAGGVTVHLDANEDIVCTFTNTDTNFVDETAPFCRGVEATIYVNAAGVIVGGPDAGQTYAGVLNGTDGDDVMVGTANADEIHGEDGRDMICARAGNDTVFGGNGKDTIYGGRGADVLRGERGSDAVIGNRGNDELYGGRGRDVVAGRRGHDTLYGGANTDLLAGGRGDDVLYGNGGDDFLRGGKGQDYLNGGNGYDFCNGGPNVDSATKCEFRWNIN